MNKTEQVQQYIKEQYGNRQAWISDIAAKLNISRAEANMLTMKAGYRRGKEKNTAPENDFGNDSDIKRIISKIPDEVIKSISF